MATSAHTVSYTGLPTGCTNIKVTVEAPGADTSSTANKIDASTLDLADGSNRVYVDSPLKDVGAGADENGLKTTITVSFLSDEPPVAGDEYAISVGDVSGTFVCTQSEMEYPVGDLVKGTATYVTAPAAS